MSSALSFKLGSGSTYFPLVGFWGRSEQAQRENVIDSRILKHPKHPDLQITTTEKKRKTKMYEP